MKSLQIRILLAAILASAAPVAAANSVSVGSVTAAPGQTSVAVNVIASTVPPATLLSVDLTFNAALCGKIQNQQIQKLGRSLADPQEGGTFCPNEGRVKIVLIDPALDGDTVIPPCTCVGDANKGGFVNFSDFGSVQANFGASANPNTAAGDANCNNFVNFSDFGSVQAGFGAPCPSGASVGGNVARWVFDVRGDATGGSFPLSVTVNEASNGPLKICGTGTVLGTGTCATPIETYGGNVAITVP